MDAILFARSGLESSGRALDARSLMIAGTGTEEIRQRDTKRLRDSYQDGKRRIARSPLKTSDNGDARADAPGKVALRPSTRKPQSPEVGGQVAGESPKSDRSTGKPAARGHGMSKRETAAARVSLGLRAVVRVGHGSRRGASSGSLPRHREET